MIDIKPNVKKTLESMKSSGYSLNNAIADIVDNSIDANATQIKITVDLNGENIQIVDNGSGMEFDRMVEALRLGSETGKNANELGKYGFGLKSASFSQCNVITVVSKLTKINEVTFDINKSIEQDNWIAYESNNYRELIETNSGTAVIWNDLYRLGIKSEDRKEKLISSMEDLRLFLSKTFYQFIDNGLELFLNGQRLESQSPFYEVHPACKILNKDVIAFGDEIIQLTAYDISAVPKRGFDDRFLLEQGISVFRNDRFISNISWISRMTHPSLNMIRIRMDVGAKEDYLLNIDFKKSNVELPAALKQEIKIFEQTAIKQYGKVGKITADRKRKRIATTDIDLMQTKSKVNIKNPINKLYLDDLEISAKQLNVYLDDLSKLNKIKDTNKLSSNEELFLYELLERIVQSDISSYEELLFTEPFNKFYEIVENYRREHE